MRAPKRSLESEIGTFYTSSVRHLLTTELAKSDFSAMSVCLFLSLSPAPSYQHFQKVSVFFPLGELARNG